MDRMEIQIQWFLPLDFFTFPLLYAALFNAIIHPMEIGIPSEMRNEKWGSSWGGMVEASEWERMRKEVQVERGEQ